MMSPINPITQIHRCSPLFSNLSICRWFSSSQTEFVWVQKRIKVQLRSDHPKHGKAGKVIRVKPGHMRQQLYPAGQALYCAKDGIPIHHFQPEPRPDMKVPPPGLSRPLNDLIQRLGIEMEITEKELKAAQAQIDLWKYSANNPTKSLSSDSSATSKLSESTPALLSPPKGLDEHLEKISESFYSIEKPFLVFKKAGPENSDTLYSSIKSDELISAIIQKLDFHAPEYQLSDYLNIIICSDSIKTFPLDNKNFNLNSFPKFKPIKSFGTYLIFLSLSSSSSSSGKLLENLNDKFYKFFIQIEK